MEEDRLLRENTLSAQMELKGRAVAADVIHVDEETIDRIQKKYCSGAPVEYLLQQSLPDAKGTRNPYILAGLLENEEGDDDDGADLDDFIVTEHCYDPKKIDWCVDDIMGFEEEDGEDAHTKEEGEAAMAVSKLLNGALLEKTTTPAMLEKRKAEYDESEREENRYLVEDLDILEKKLNKPPPGIFPEPLYLKEDGNKRKRVNGSEEEKSTLFQAIILTAADFGITSVNGVLDLHAVAVGKNESRPFWDVMRHRLDSMDPLWRTIRKRALSHYVGEWFDKGKSGMKELSYQ